MLSTLLNSLIIRRHYYFAATLLLTVLCGYGITKIQVNGSFESMFPESSPNLHADNAIRTDYVQGERVLLVIRTKDHTVFTPQTLQLVDEITQKLWIAPFSIRVDSLTNYLRSHTKDDTFYVDPLIPNLEHLTQENIEFISSFAKSDIYIANAMLSNDEQATALFLTLAVPDEKKAKDLAFKEVNTYLAELVAQINTSHTDIEANYIGQARLAAEGADLILKNITTLLPISSILLFIVLGTLLRSFVAVIATMLTVFVSLIVAMGTAGWLGMEINIMSLMAPSMIMVLATADAVHLITQYIVETNRGRTKEQALRLSIELNSKPILLTSITTAIGLAAMLFGESPAFLSFSIIVSMGVLIAFVVTFTFTPSVMLFFPVKPGVKKELAVSHLLLWISNIAVARRKPIVIITILLLPVFLSFLPRIYFNDNPLAYITDDEPLHQSMSFINEAVSGGDVMLFSFESGSESGINEPVFLTKVDAFQEWLRQQPLVTYVNSFADTTKHLNKAMHNNQETFFTIPETRELSAQYMLLYEMSLPQGTDLTRDINNERSALKITAGLNVGGNDNFIDLEAKANQWMSENAPEFMGPAGGKRIIFAQSNQIIIDNMIFGSLLALIFISFTIMIGIGSIRYGALSLIANISPSIFVFGAWALLVQEANMIFTISFALTLGIVVDDTVHILTKYVAARQRGDSPEQSIEYALTTSGIALLVTTLALSAGVISFIFASYIPLITSGIIFASIAGTALILDLFFLPGLLIYYETFYKRLYGRSLFEPSESKREAENSSINLQ